MTTSGVTTTNTWEAQKTVRVYLKSGFSVAGLQKVLTLPGAKVLLRDVLCETGGKSRLPCPEIFRWELFVTLILCKVWALWP